MNINKYNLYISKYSQFDNKSYESNLQKLLSQPFSQDHSHKAPSNSYYQISSLDILEPLQKTIQRLNNFLVEKQLSSNIFPQLRNVDLSNYGVVLSKDISPSGIKGLSLFDLHNLTNKYYKKVGLTVTYYSRDQSTIDLAIRGSSLAGSSPGIQRALFRIAADNHRWVNCRILFYQPRKNNS